MMRPASKVTSSGPSVNPQILAARTLERIIRAPWMAAKSVSRVWALVGRAEVGVWVLASGVGFGKIKHLLLRYLGVGGRLVGRRKDCTAILGPHKY